MRPNTQTAHSTHPFRPLHDPDGTPAAATGVLLIPTLSQSTRPPQHSHESILKDSLKALTGQITSLRSGTAGSLEPLLVLCTHLKESEDLLIQAQRLIHASKEVDQLRQAVPIFFRYLADYLDRHQDIRLSIDSLHTLCLGLGALAPAIAKPLLTPAQCRASQAVITRLSSALAGQLVSHFEHQVLDAGNLLNCLNWFSRAIKAELLPQQTPVATHLFQTALTQLEHWSASSHTTCLSSRQLAKAMVQLNTMVSKNLINIDGTALAGAANRATWASCVHNLCRQFLSNDQWLKGCHGVELINVTNALKDGLELRLLDGCSTHFKKAFAQIARRINQQSFTGSASLTTLSNSANFLRCLFEHGLLGDRASDSGQAVLHLLDQINGLAQCDDLNDHDVQALVNLASFLKATDRWLALQPKSANQTIWATLAQASQSLVAILHQISVRDPQWMQSPQSGSALLSALQHLAQRGLLGSSDGKPLQALIRQLLEAIPLWQVKPRHSVSLLQSLRALTAFLQHPLSDTVPEAASAGGPALAHLLQHLQQNLSAQISNDERLACLQAVQTGAALGMVSVEDCQPLLQQLLKTTAPVDLARLAQAIRDSGLLTETVEPLAESALQPISVAASPPTALQAKPRGATYRADVAQPTSSSAVTVTSPPAASRTNSDQWIAPRHAAKPSQITTAAQLASSSLLTASLFDEPLLSSRPPARAATSAAGGKPRVTSVVAESRSAKQPERVQARPSKQGGLTWQQAQQEWFRLVGDAGTKPLPRMKELADLHPDLLNQKSPGKKGQTALFHAIKQGRKDIVAWLLAHDRHRFDTDLGQFMLEVLNQVAPIEKRHIAVLRLLIESVVKSHDQKLSDAHAQAQPGAQPLSKKELHHRRAALLSDQQKEALARFSAVRGLFEEFKLLPPQSAAVMPPPATPTARVQRPAQSGLDLSSDIDRAGSHGIVATIRGQTIRTATEASNDHVKKTVLMISAETGRAALVQQTLANAADVDALLHAKDNDGMTVLAYAARRGQTAIVSMLLAAARDKAALVRMSDLYGITPLMRAAANGHTDAAKAILNAIDDKEALVRMQNATGNNALMVAAFDGHTDTVTALLSVISDKEALIRTQCALGNNALTGPAMNGHTETVNALLSVVNDKDALIRMPNELGNNALIYAALNGHTETTMAMLEVATDKEALIQTQGESGQSALLGAAVNGHAATVMALLSVADNKDALIKTQNNDGDHALTVAAINGNTDVVKALLSVTADKDALIRMQNDEGDNALTAAALTGYTGTLKTLLDAAGDKEALIRMRNNEGDHVLTIAALNGHTDTVKMLLNIASDKEALIRTPNEAGYNALTCAAMYGHTETVTAIMSVVRDKEALIGMENDAGETALSCAALQGHTETLLALLNMVNDKAAMIGRQNASGYNPLMSAAFCGHTVSVIAMLIQVSDKRALIHQRNAQGKTALDIAAARGHDDTLKALQNALLS